MSTTEAKAIGLERDIKHRGRKGGRELALAELIFVFFYCNNIDHFCLCHQVFKQQQKKKKKKKKKYLVRSLIKECLEGRTGCPRR